MDLLMTIKSNLRKRAFKTLFLKTNRFEGTSEKYRYSYIS